MVKNHFATLGVKVGASEDDIKKAYRSLAKQWHPDKNKNPGAEDKFKEIAAAYDYLQSKDRREILARDLNKPVTQTTAKTSSGASTSYQTGSAPSYNWNYKGTERNEPRDESGPSNTAGTSQGKENYKPESKKKKTPSGSFHKKPADTTETKHTPQWKPWSNEEWEQEYGGPPLIPNFSAAFTNFRFFVGQLDSHFGPSFFFGIGTNPRGLFGEADPFASGPETSERNKPQKREPRYVASEHGYSGGLDDDLLFTPRSVNEERPGQCPVCKKLISGNKLARHVKYCGSFDAPNDSEEDDPRSKQTYWSDVGKENDNHYPETNRQKQEKDWRDRHEDMLKQIRRDRHAYQDKLNRETSEMHACQWCGQTFTLTALNQHMNVCKEYVLRFGNPLNPKFPAGPSSESKLSRARQYSKSIPRPKARSSFSSRETENTNEPQSSDKHSRQRPFSSTPSSSHYSQNCDNGSPSDSTSAEKAPSKKFSSPDKTRRSSFTKNSTSPTGREKPTATKESQQNNSNASHFSGNLSGHKFKGTGSKSRKDAS